MNILLLSTHLNAGGISSYLLALTGGLTWRGHTVHVATSGGGMEEAFMSAGAKLVKLNIRTKSELDPRIYAALGFLAGYIRRNRIDLIHAHTRITQVMGACLKRLTGRPYLSTCHGFFKIRLSRKLAPCWGDAVIAISQAVVDHLVLGFHVPPQKVYLIASGVDVSAFFPVTGEERIEGRRRLKLTGGPIVGIVARLSDVKGQDVLIEAIAEVRKHYPAIQLLIVGQGRTKDQLQASVRRLGLGGHVRFFSTTNETHAMLALLDVFVMPSRQEGLGISIMEAQAAGVPVVASRVGGIPSLIEHGKTGILVDPENSRALAEAITGLLKDNVSQRAIGMAGREFISKNYSADQMIDRTEQLYRICLGEVEKGGPVRGRTGR